MDNKVYIIYTALKRAYDLTDPDAEKIAKWLIRLTVHPNHPLATPPLELVTRVLGEHTTRLSQELAKGIALHSPFDDEEAAPFASGLIQTHMSAEQILCNWLDRQEAQANAGPAIEDFFDTEGETDPRKLRYAALVGVLVDKYGFGTEEVDLYAARLDEDLDEDGPEVVINFLSDLLLQVRGEIASEIATAVDEATNGALDTDLAYRDASNMLDKHLADEAILRLWYEKNR